MLTANVEIHLVEDGHLPDMDTDVICYLDDGDATLGAIDETGWVDAGGMAFAHRGQRVVAWSEFPVMPEEVSA